LRRRKTKGGGTYYKSESISRQPEVWMLHYYKVYYIIIIKSGCFIMQEIRKNLNVYTLNNLLLTIINSGGRCADIHCTRAVAISLLTPDVRAVV
jgi:hypothetical protein